MSADLLKRLANAGTPMDLVMEVAESLAEARAAERLLEKRREKDRERKRNPRNSTESTDGAETAERVSLDKEKPPTPPKEINPFPHTRDTRAKAKHPLPANWQPIALKADGQAGRIIETWQAGRIERELSKFKDNALQNRRLCADWDAAWRNWIKQADEYDDRQGRKSVQCGKTTAAIAALGGFHDDRPM